jgi:DNA-binding FadR family transcriptional regulator
MEGAGSRADYGALDRRFHERVARATHNPLLWRLVEVTSDWMASIRQDTLQSARRRTTSMAGHKAILDALVRHDADAAAAATIAHIREIGSIVADASRRPTHGARLVAAPPPSAPSRRRRNGRPPRG